MPDVPISPQGLETSPATIPILEPEHQTVVPPEQATVTPVLISPAVG